MAKEFMKARTVAVDTKTGCLEQWQDQEVAGTLAQRSGSTPLIRTEAREKRESFSGNGKGSCQQLPKCTGPTADPEQGASLRHKH